MNLKEKLARAAAAIAAMVMAMIRAIFGGVKEAGQSIAADARMVAGGVREAVAHTAQLAGRGLAGPARALDFATGTVGSVLGVLLPRRPVGPRDVADAAVNRDNRRPAALPVGQIPPAARAELQEVMMLGGAVQRAAEARASGDLGRAAFLDQDLPPNVGAWLAGLSPNDLRHIARAEITHVAAHVQGRAALAGIPAVPPLASQPAPAALDTRKLLAEIRARAATDRAEVAAMMKRGPRPVLPTEDDAEEYAPRRSGPGPRPAFG
ncbi:hypothetical protein ACFQE0_14140 [Methylobacterium komagatae]|uniref:DUF937 domain-containing protein n=1 Tax=Methylobacterium komagatae TaxID=374425 RepID=A0ABW2BM33_9HYPH